MNKQMTIESNRYYLNKTSCKKELFYGKKRTSITPRSEKKMTAENFLIQTTVDLNVGVGWTGS